MESVDAVGIVRSHAGQICLVQIHVASIAVEVVVIDVMHAYQSLCQVLLAAEAPASELASELASLPTRSE